MTLPQRPPRPVLIPYPDHWQLREDVFFLEGPFNLHAEPSLEPVADVLEEALRTFGEVHHNEGPGQAVRLLLEPHQKPEGYTLRISAEGIELKGCREGIARGIATLRQLLFQPLQHDGRPALPGSEIIDAPKYEWRGVLLDCSRHFFSVEKTLQYIDLLSLFKMNRFHWHLTDDQGWRIEIQKYPKLTEIGAWRGKEHARYGGYYTGDEIRKVVAYAAARGIEVVPEIDIPGHSTAIVAAYPEYGCGEDKVEVDTTWGIKTVNLNPGLDETFTFLEGLFEEVAELFPSKCIHVGADECTKEPWQQNAACQKRIADEGLQDEKELQTWFLNRVLDILKKHDRIGVGWDEVMEGGLPENIIVQSWRDHQFTADAARQGASVIATPAPWCYLNFGADTISLARAHSFNPMPGDLEPELHDRILGGECTFWSEFITENMIDYLAFPRMLATAEALWKPSGRPATYDHFEARVRMFYPVLEALDLNYGPAYALQEPHHRVLGRKRDFHPIVD